MADLFSEARFFATEKDGSLIDQLADRYETDASTVNNALAKISLTSAELFKKNKTSIEKRYTPRERDEGEANEDDVRIGTLLVVPKVLHEILTDGYEAAWREPQLQAFRTDYSGFMGAKIEALIKNSSFRPITYTDNSNYIKQQVKPTVLVWVSAIKKLLDVTPYLTVVNTFNGDGGGNFSFNLTPIFPELLVSTELASLTSQNETRYGRDEINAMYAALKNQSDGSYHKQSIQQDIIYKSLAIAGQRRGMDDNPIGRTVWEIMFQPNDMVFIKHEQIVIEVVEKPIKFKGSTLADAENYQWAMIGFIDKSDITMTPQGMYSTSVTGRDFSKFLLEDGVFFFPLGEDTEERSDSYMANVTPADRANPNYTRLFGKIQDITLYTHQRVQVLMDYVFEKFNTITVVDERDVSHITKSDRRGAWKYTETIYSEVGGRLITDDSFATDQGSMQNFLDKVAQKPFLEIMSDTYGDRFYWIVRQPPWSKTSYINQYELANEGAGIVVKSDAIREINVNYDDQNSYAWYRLQPKAYLFGNETLTNFAFPAVYFPEFALKYGVKSLDVTSTYLDYGTANSGVNSAYLAGLRDLKYLIETHAHLPFTKKGTLALEGYSTIRRGMVIYVQPIDMYFYVEGVGDTTKVQENQTDRLTTVQVSRGIRGAHYDKYFQLIDFGNQDNEVSFDDLSYQAGEERDVTVEELEEISPNVFRDGIKNWKVNPDIWEFFMQRGHEL